MPYIVRLRRLFSGSRRVTDFRSLFLTVVLATMMGVAVSARQPQQGEGEVKTLPAPLSVTLTADGETRTLLTSAKTVQELLTEHHLKLGKLDRCSYPLSTAVKEGMALSITRIRTEMTAERVAIPFPTRERYSPVLRIGSRVVKQAGKLGERVKYFRDVYKNGDRVSRTKLKERVAAPRPQVVAVGTRGMTLASRGYFSGRRIVDMHATGYGPGAACNGKWAGRTASGLRPGHGVVAVDPRFIPLGTRLYIDGYGYAVAGDTGGAIKGNRIDLGYDTYSEALRFGRRRVKVLILN